MNHKKILSTSAFLKIEAFWWWFNKNRLGLENALLYYENTEQSLNNFKNKIAQISKYHGFVLKSPNKDKSLYFTYIFTVGGQLKKVRRVYAIENLAPTFLNWKIQSLIQPCENVELIKSGNNKSIKIINYE